MKKLVLALVLLLLSVKPVIAATEDALPVFCDDTKKVFEQLKSKIESFKSYLVGLTNHKSLGSMTNTDLLNIRDEILGDMNQFLYLLTFK